MKKIIFFFYISIFSNSGFSQRVVSPLPTKQQLAWHEQEFYLFMHFGPNTFTNKEWGEGTEPEDIFNPSQLDCRQWCRIAKAAGAKGIIITAKHHDGFCLWPSKYSKHTVRESKWKNGKGDVLKDLSQACREYGLKFGVYLSPWDRNHPKYGTNEYNDVFVNMMKEIFTSYGPVWELWWDGANGEGPNGKKQVYDWKRFENTVRKLSPNTVVFSDIGPDIRWVGNEQGFAGETNWNFLDTAGFTRGLGAPHVDTLNIGNYNGKNWIPAECDVSIRPGWFYHKEEDSKVKTPEELFAIYLKSVGRGANLLLNVPPDQRGKIHEKDSAALIGFKKIRGASFKQGILSDPENKFKLIFDPALISFNGKTETLEFKTASENSISISFEKPVEFNTVVIRENLQFGQRVRQFVVQILDENNKSHFVYGTSIGHKRILTFPKIKTSYVAIRLLQADKPAMLGVFDFYMIDEKLISK